jgi:group I intron endonuclease
MGIVYIAVNNVNGKTYVGQTCRTFKWRLDKHKTKKDILWQAITKHGIENFTFIENEVPECFMDNLEISLIKLYDCITPKGYNIDGGGCKNKHLHPETKRKIAESKMGSKNPMYGKHFSEDHVRRMAESRTGKKNGMYGKHHQGDTKKLMRQKKIGKAPWNKGLIGGHSPKPKGQLSPNFGKHRPRWPGE